MRAIGILLAGWIVALPAAAAAPPLALHVEVGNLWTAWPGGAVRAANIESVNTFLAEFEKAFNLKPGRLQSATLVLGDSEANRTRFALRLQFKKPYDRAAFATMMNATLDEKTGRLVFPPEAKHDGVVPEVDVSDPLRVTVQMGFPADALPEVQTAAAGQHLYLVARREWLQESGVSLPKLFAPLLESDAVTITGQLGADESLALTMSTSSAHPMQRAAAVKSMTSLKAFLQNLSALAAVEPNEELNNRYGMNNSLGGFHLLLKVLAPAFAAATATPTDTGTILSLVVPANLPLAPVLTTLDQDRPAGFSPSERAMTQNNLNQLALAMHNYADAQGSGFPPAATTSPDGKPLLSWRVAILPYLEQKALYDKFKLDEPWDSEHNKKVFSDNPMPKVFEVAGLTEPNGKTTHFQVFIGDGTIFENQKNRPQFKDIEDGMSNTILVAVAAEPVEWTRPADMEYDPKADPKPRLRSLRRKFSVVMADGAALAIDEEIAVEMLHRVITKADGKVVDLEVTPKK